ncbi:titin-like isoform X3 [Drosophila subpulchrella]|uniref:titin-like isoform X3 n=1 Tax=Drosophila subpulchrella TaxID=1486046 RepID=UPI0018A1AE5E|nr:titin-like isoform X3 [Drosophila subpulchrella]
MKRRGNNKGKSGVGVLELHQVKRLDMSDQVAIVKRPKYLPNLHNLVMPQICYEHSNRVVAARLSIEVHKHDQDAADFFEGAEAPCLNVPRTLFPNRAPVDKIIFMPRLLLPVGFDAGGVFAPGAIPRRFYPMGLMPPSHKGPTPPLFVGLRTKDFQMPVEVQKLLEKVPPAITTVLPTTTPPKMETKIDIGYTPNYRPPPLSNATGKDRAAEGPSLEMRMIRHDVTLSMVYTTPTAPKPPTSHPFRHLPVQYNIYTPDLSNVLVVMSRVSKLTVAILSTIVHPHAPAVAMATMGDEKCPNFELPSEVFPTCDGLKRPIFLPERFQPKGFKAGCIFKPGSLPESFFRENFWKAGTPQPQHSNGITPPLFVGKFTTARAASAFLKTIQEEGKQRMADASGSSAEASGSGSVQTVEFNTTKVRCTTKGFLVLETENPATPPGAHSLKNYLHAYNAGCFVMVVRDEEREELEEPEEPMVPPAFSRIGLRCCAVCVDPAGSPGSTDREEFFPEENEKKAEEKKPNEAGSINNQSDTPDPDNLPEIQLDDTYIVTDPEECFEENGKEPKPTGPTAEYIINRPGTPFPHALPEILLGDKTYANTDLKESLEGENGKEPEETKTIESTIISRPGIPHPRGILLDDKTNVSTHPEESLEGENGKEPKETKPTEFTAWSIPSRSKAPNPYEFPKPKPIMDRPGAPYQNEPIMDRPGTPYQNVFPEILLDAKTYAVGDPKESFEGENGKEPKETKPTESTAWSIPSRSKAPNPYEFPKPKPIMDRPGAPYQNEPIMDRPGTPYQNVFPEILLDAKTYAVEDPKESFEGENGKEPKDTKPTESTAWSIPSRSKAPNPYEFPKPKPIMDRPGAPYQNEPIMDRPGTPYQNVFPEILLDAKTYAVGDPKESFEGENGKEPKETKPTESTAGSITSRSKAPNPYDFPKPKPIMNLPGTPYQNEPIMDRPGTPYQNVLPEILLDAKTYAVEDPKESFEGENGKEPKETKPTESTAGSITSRSKAPNPYEFPKPKPIMDRPGAPYQNEPIMDRPGTPYQNEPIMDRPGTPYQNVLPEILLDAKTYAVGDPKESFEGENGKEPKDTKPTESTAWSIPSRSKAPNPYEFPKPKPIMDRPGAPYQNEPIMDRPGTPYQNVLPEILLDAKTYAVGDPKESFEGENGKEPKETKPTESTTWSIPSRSKAPNPYEFPKPKPIMDRPGTPYQNEPIMDRPGTPYQNVLPEILLDAKTYAVEDPKESFEGENGKEPKDTKPTESTAPSIPSRSKAPNPYEFPKPKPIMDRPGTPYQNVLPEILLDAKTYAVGDPKESFEGENGKDPKETKPTESTAGSIISRSKAPHPYDFPDPEPFEGRNRKENWKRTKPTDLNDTIFLSDTESTDYDAELQMIATDIETESESEERDEIRDHTD